MFQLNGKIALVTGATGGIGQAIVKNLHQQGADVVLTGTREPVLKELAQSFNSQRVHYVVADLSDKTQADKILQKTQELVGPPDILVNNAGLLRDNVFLRMKDQDWDDVLNVDLTAPFRLCRAVIRGMIRNRYGRIINIASIVGLTGNAGQANYCAAKAGLLGMSKALAREVGKRGVTVNVVSPGFITTAMTEGLPQAQKDALLSQIPVGRFGKPEDIAAMVSFLVSQEAGWITGANMNVNGGMMMG